MHKLISVGHPQSNEEVEVTNRTILHGLKIRLNEAKGLWVEELNSVLWAYRTTPHVPTGESPFSLAYGEAMIPLEIGLSLTESSSTASRATPSIGGPTWTSYPNSDARLNSAWPPTDKGWPDTIMLRLS